MELETVRVLVVDDYAPWRRFICSSLEKQPELQIVGEVADGLEAIRKVIELQPDLIVLDIGLPSMNGMEIVRRIPEFSPRSKVLMISEERSAEVADEALRRGASGYIVKSGAASELLPAVDSVLQGKRFLSAHLLGAVLPEFEKGQVRGAFRDNEAMALRKTNMPRHEVEFHCGESSLVAGFADKIEAELAHGNTVVFVATPSHRADLLAALTARGLDVDALVQSGSLFLLDTMETLSEQLLDGMPDARRLARVVTRFLDRVNASAAGPRRRVVFCGECAPVLMQQGKIEAALQTEHLWDELTKTHEIDVLCGYLSTALPAEHRDEIVARICAEHTKASGREAVC